MKNWQLYRCLNAFLPRGAAPEDALSRVMWRHHAVGGTAAVFENGKIMKSAAWGLSRRAPRTQAAIRTVYRAASVSKLVTALGAMKLREEGRIDLDADISGILGGECGDILSAHSVITLRMLLTHTSGLRDGHIYQQSILRGVRLSDILHGDSFGEQGVLEYSNLGAGIAGAVMARATDTPFDTLMCETVFEPLGVSASFFPARMADNLADAYRIMPPRRTANFDAAARIKKPPRDTVDPEFDYALAHGNLCISAPDLCRIGMALCEEGFLSKESLDEMRAPVASFGKRADNLQQGIGTFVLDDPALFRRTLYGHQGLAYGAVHGLFFDPETKRGFALLTSGVSEARKGVLADVNADIIREVFGGVS